MSWYTIFYLFSLADKISGVFKVLTIVLGICLFITLAFLMGAESYDSDDWKKWRKFFFTFFISFFISITFWTFIPDRKDMLMIIAGGAVGEFIVNDPNAKQLPADITKFLRKEILEATITEINGKSEEERKLDSLKSLSKEQLIELLKDKK
jgi:hypothetical protein